MKTGPVKHLLVDLDGTLLGNRNIALSVDFVSQALKALKKYGGWRKAAETLLAINQEFKNPKAEKRNDVRIIELFSEKMGLSFEEGRTVLRDNVSVIFAGLEKHFYPMQGAREFLDWAKTKFHLVLATNPVWPANVIEMRVRWAGIDPAIFGQLTHITKMHSCKPELSYYREILSFLKSTPEEALLVGNEMKMDLPASYVGIRVFIVGRSKRCEKIKDSKSIAPAWKGSFANLKDLLLSSSVL